MPIADILHQKHTDRPAASTEILSVSSHSSQSSNISTLQEWPIKRILRETSKEYLIDWEGPYDPTWVSCRCYLSSKGARGAYGALTDKWAPIMRI